MIEFYELNDSDSGDSRIEVDLSLMDESPDLERPWLLWLFVKVSDGTDKEFVAFRDDLIQTLEAQMEARYAGTVTKEGWSELYFYASTSKKFENLTSETMSRHTPYTYERGSFKDTKWEMYLEKLYPEPYALITIQNRETIAALVDAGDDLTLSREVEHYLFFQTPTALERFANSMIEQGYAMKEHLTNDESEYSYGVTLSKNECITPKQVEESTSLLFELVMQEHGIYEGWSTVLGGENHGVE